MRLAPFAAYASTKFEQHTPLATTAGERCFLPRSLSLSNSLGPGYVRRAYLPCYTHLRPCQHVKVIRPAAGLFLNPLQVVSGGAHKCSHSKQTQTQHKMRFPGDTFMHGTHCTTHRRQTTTTTTVSKSPRMRLLPIESWCGRFAIPTHYHGQ